MKTIAGWLSARRVLRAIWHQIRPGGPWALRQWKCQRTNVVGATIISAAPPLELPIPSPIIPVKVQPILERTVQEFSPIASLAVLVKVAQMGCEIQICLRDGTELERPVVFIFKPNDG